MRGQFWEVVQRLAATLPDQDPTNQADAFPGDPLGRRRPLKEHVELRGSVVVSQRDGYIFVLFTHDTSRPRLNEETKK